MKLHKSQKRPEAAAWARRLLRKAGITCRLPAIYVIRRSKRGVDSGWVWGRCYWRRRGGFITLHIPRGADRRDMLILLAHELTHWVNYKKDLNLVRHSPHGPRFQWQLWRLLPRYLWDRASCGQWIATSSAHDPSFRPDRASLAA